jgi:arylsulfatase A-like enzyme
LSGIAAAQNPQAIRNDPLSKGLLAAAMEGCVFWMAYGAVEFVIATLLPFWNDSLAVATAVTWRWTGVLLAGYLVAGALTGALGRLAVHLVELPGGTRQPALERRAERYAGALALAIAFITGLLLRYHPRGTERFFLTLAVVVAVALGAACCSALWEERLRPILRPWPVAFLLVAPSGVIVDLLSGASATGRVAASLAVMGATVAAAWAWQRVRGSVTGSSHQSFMRRLALPLGAIALLAGGMLFISSQRSLNLEKAASRLSGTAHGPNVVLVSLDTVRADHTFVGGYERDTTPHLRQFAKDGVVYTNLFAASDTTLSTHASMFTGLYPRQHGAILTPPGEPVGRALAPSFTTLAKVLARNGYVTMGISANAGFLAPIWGLTQGFQVYDTHSVVSIEQPVTAYLRSLARTLLNPFVATQDFDLIIRRSEDINRDAFALLDAVQKKGTSFFLFLNFMDAHHPYAPPPPFDRQFPGKDPGFIGSRYSELEQLLNQRVRNLTAKEHEALRSQYDGGIAYEDRQVGRLIEKLKSLGLYENTLILITADHGEHEGEHQLLLHAKSVYQPLIHVPLVIKYPGRPQAGVVDTPVSQIDFMPTILATAGIPVPSGLTGLDLRTVNTAPPRVLVSVSHSPRAVIHETATALMANGMKYIDSTLGTRELFDLARDPGEQTNLYRADDPLSRSMRASLSEWEKKTPAFREPQNKIDQETIRRLKSLGYVQ